MAIKDYSGTAADNIAISGISILGTADVKNFDNAMRQQMADIANWTDADTLASASTVDLGSVEGMYVTVSGTTTITALGTLKAGMVKFVYFSGALTLTHNATSLILPGAANITTVAGDTAVFVSEGSGNWRCAAFTPVDGLPAWRRIGSVEISSSTASADIVIPSWAKHVRMSGYFRPVTDGDSLWLRCAVAGTFDTTAGNYVNQYVRGDDTVMDSARDTTTLTALILVPSCDNTGSGGGTFTASLSEVAIARRTWVDVNSSYSSPSGNVQKVVSAQSFIPSSIVSNIRFLASSGNISILDAVIEASR